MLSDAEIVRICREELTKAQGWDSDELASNRERALDYFYNRPRGDEKPGQSSIQSSDVSDMVEAIMSGIGPILTNETLIQFEASGEADEDQAQLESDFVSYMVAGQNDGYVEVKSSVKDALLLRNGFIKVSVEKEDSETSERLINQTEADIQVLAESSNNEKTIILSDITANKKQIDNYDVIVNTEIHRTELVVESIAPENILYAPDHSSPDLSDIRFIAERKILTQTELLDLGYSKDLVKLIPSYDVDVKSDSVARKQDSQTALDTADPATRSIETWEIHILIDIKENGRALLHRIHLAEQQLLMKERADWVPYATGSPFLVPHRLYGQSVFDKLKSIQDSKTHFLRQWHDNTRLANQVRLGALENAVNLQDAIDGANIIRIKRPDALVPIVVPDMGQSIQAALGYLDKVRSERGGASLDMGSAELQLAGQVGDQGAERQITMKEQLAAMMTETLANTLIRSTYLLVHRTLRTFLPGELTAKLNGKWVDTNPSQWPARKKTNVMTGLSQGQKVTRVNALNQVIGMQIQALSNGMEGQLINKGQVYNALMDLSRAAGLDNPDQYWTDPDSPQAQQAAQEQAQQAEAAQQAAATAQAQQAQLQQQVFLMQAQIEKYKNDTELAYKYAADSLKAEIEEAKIVADVASLNQKQAQFDSQAAQANARVDNVA